MQEAGNLPASCVFRVMGLKADTAGYYMESWQLSGCHRLSASPWSEVYEVTYLAQPAILKLVKPDGDEAESAAVLKYYGGRGAVRLLHHEGNAMLLERLEQTPSLKQMVIDGHDDDATRIMAAIIAQLLEKRPQPVAEGTRTLRRHFRALFEKAESDRKLQQSSIYIKAADIAQQLLDDGSHDALLHGDIHHQNIMHSPRGWLAIDPKGLIGDAAYEAANVICNPHGLPDIVHDIKRMQRQFDILQECLGLERERMVAFAFVHACLSACWSVEDGENPDFAISCARLLDTLT
jgi:streptomycin 6-kinase